MGAMRELNPEAGNLEFVGAKIRKFRLRADLSQADLAARTNFDASTVAKYERAEYVPREDFLIAADEVLEADGNLADCVSLVKKERYPTSFRPWLDIERNAVELVSYHLNVVPGLLQTEQYARALFQTYEPRASGEEIEERVRARTERTSLLAPDGPTLSAVINESALHYAVGGAKVMAEQLEMLVDVIERDTARVHVLPSDAGAHAAISGGAFSIATLQDRSQYALLDNVTNGHVTSNPDDLLTVSRLYEVLRSEALPSHASVQHIQEVITKWQQQIST